MVLNATKCYGNTHMTYKRGFMKSVHDLDSEIMAGREPNLIIKEKEALINSETGVSFRIQLNLVENFLIGGIRLRRLTKLFHKKRIGNG